MRNTHSAIAEARSSGETLLTLIHERLFDEESRTGHEGGWKAALDKLENLVA